MRFLVHVAVAVVAVEPEAELERFERGTGMHQSHGDPVLERHLIDTRCQGENGVEFVGGNLYDKLHPNITDSAAACCVLCQEEEKCQIWSYRATCCGNKYSGCCWMKRAAGASRKPGNDAISGTSNGSVPVPPGHRYRCVDTHCVRDPTGGFGTITCNDSCATGRQETGLAPLKYTALPVGAVQPTGWLGDQLETQVNGLSGHLERFWPDVQNSTWLHPNGRWQETYSDRGGNFPYWLNGVIPLVFQTRAVSDAVDSSGYNLTDVVLGNMRTLLSNQKERSLPMYKMWSLGTWNVVRSMMMLMSARPDTIDEFLPFVKGYIGASQAMLIAKGWPDGGSVVTQCDGRNPTCSNVVPGSSSHPIVRYPDWMWILQELHDTPGVDSATQAVIMQHMRLVGEWGTDFEQFYGNPCNATAPPHRNLTELPNCFPTTSCNSDRVADNCKGYSLPPPQHTRLATHGVSGAAMPLKEGAVRWRMTRLPQHWNLSYLKLDTLDRYHGQPTGMYSADEHLAGRNPSRGVELCTIVETIFSLNVMHRIQGDIAFTDRAEKVMYNAFPAAMTADMWRHNYLSTINEVQAVTSPHHLPGDGDNATVYGLADRYTGVTPCCTANFNQAWPKFTMATVLASPSPENAIVVSIYAPVNATMPAEVGGAATVSLITDYPFGDTVTVRVRAAVAVPLKLRIPGWATKATVAVNGGAAGPTTPLSYHTVVCNGGDVTDVVIELNPEIRVETGWGARKGADLDAAVVFRGPLMYAFGLDETQHLLHKPWACFESGCSTDISMTSNGSWAYALVLPATDEASVGQRHHQRGSASRDSNGITTRGAPKTMHFSRSGPPGPVPFAGGANVKMRIEVTARLVKAWRMDPDFPESPMAPPVSPVCTAAGDCGPAVKITLVPYGATKLRIGMMPWTHK